MLVLRTSNFQGATIRPIVPTNRYGALRCSVFSVVSFSDDITSIQFYMSTVDF